MEAPTASQYGQTDHWSLTGSSHPSKICFLFPWISTFVQRFSFFFLEYVPHPLLQAQLNPFCCKKAFYILQGIWIFLFFPCILSSYLLHLYLSSRPPYTHMHIIKCWRRRQNKLYLESRTPSWAGLDCELYAQYLWKQHTNWKTRAPERRAPGLSIPKRIP